MRRCPIHARREGFALMIVVLGTLLLSGITLATLRMASDEMSAARATRVSASALYAAETGVRATEIGWPVAAGALPAGDSLDLGWTMLTGRSSYRSMIHRRDAGGGDTAIFSLTVVGRSYGPLGGEAAVQVWLTQSPGTRTFAHAIAAQEQITISGAGFTDSYDSGLGSYGGANIANNGHVRANGSIVINGTSAPTIRGNAITAGAVTPMSNVSGTVTQAAPAQFEPAEACPPGQTWATSSGSRTLTTGTYYFHDFTLANPSEALLVPAGNRVTIYIDGRLTISGEIDNGTMQAANLSFIICGGHADATIRGGTNAYYTVHAPGNDVTLEGDLPIHGAIVARNLSAAGGAPIHFDETLAVAAPAPRARLISRSWAQLLR